MAGIIVSLGTGANCKFEEIRREFELSKGLKVNNVYTNDTCNIAKYKRTNDTMDFNWFESANVIVCAIGTILFRKYSIDDSIHGIGKVLCGDVCISEIADDIDGHFCLVIVEKKQKKCHIMTDSGGIINTYIIRSGENFYICSSMLSLAKVFTVTPNQKSILMFLRSGMFFDEKTYFNEIETLKPASIYTYFFNSRKMSRKKYWYVPKKVNECITFEEAASRITKLLMRIIDAIPTKEALYDFTGGYDSRFVLSFVYGTKKDKSCINTFFFGPPNSREAKIVEKNCVNLGIAHNNYVVHDNWEEKFYDYILESNNLCDGLENACAYAPILMTQKWKRKYFRYTVHGLFGELYRQRTWEFEFGKRGRKKPANFTRMIKYRNLADDFDKSIFSVTYLKILNQVPEMLLNIYKNTNKMFDRETPNTLQLDNVYYMQRARRWGGRNITTANQIIQPICPLWFRKPLEISLLLPAEYKKRCKLMRYIVEKEFPKFAKEKMITGTPFVLINLKNIHLFIPGIFFFLRKAIRKFSQIAFNKTIWSGLTTPDYNTGDWYRKALQDPRCKVLLDWDRMVSRKFYDQQYFESFIEKAKCKNFHFYGQLGNMITVEMTLRAAKLETEIGD